MFSSIKMYYVFKQKLMRLCRKEKNSMNLNFTLEVTADFYQKIREKRINVQ